LFSSVSLAVVVGLSTVVGCFGWNSAVTVVRITLEE